MDPRCIAAVCACLAFILIVVGFLVFKYVQNCSNIAKEVVISKFNNVSTYTVQNNKNESPEIRKEIARRLNSLAEKGDKLVVECFNRGFPDPVTAERLAKRWQFLRKNNALRETAFGEKSAAYTVNKGDELRICMRRNNELEDENTSMFVLLHEMAHLASKSWDHSDEFKAHFAKLVRAAVDLGLYKYQDFSKRPEDYCGVEITNPAYAK